ncbi:MBL fold metallo-hydrolase [Staphylothermus hellenicus]|uniref:Beta-lactamase domain protein n=1 Tax=Staphylothermus hellenicus (strain DSM 12710 / JCM 10830 / BK20S6-10-b1 / P8) TaxID=591019 RepID=D7D9F0_STAHD|nr:MBL fold metallo-hydrolase [Staphylothermus hellenicus]ADI32396.1 beta-lactamase domain protein [Staphylothermus hellenicus DSM 12710]
MIKITVLVDDRPYIEGLKTRRGLSIYVEINNNFLLFDLGPDSGVLQYNSDRLDVNLDLIDAATISHAHSDHMGGLQLLGWAAPFLKIFIPYDSMDSVGRMVRNNGLTPVEVIDWVKLWRNTYITKPIHGPPWEHFLVINTPKGIIVFSGCMHAGVDKVLKTITGYLGDRIRGVIGGFHLENAPRKIVEASVKLLMEKYGVDFVIPLHCSGELFRSILRNNYRDKYIDAGAGFTYEL